MSENTVTLTNLTDVIEKHLEATDKNQDKVWTKREIGDLVTRVIGESLDLGRYCQKLLIENYLLISNLTNKNPQIYTDPEDLISYWDFKELFEIIEQLNEDKRNSKESTYLNESICSEIKELIIQKAKNKST